MSSNNDDKTIITDAANLTIFQSSSRKKACFVQYSGAALGRRYVVEGPDVTIGRAPTTGIVIPEGSVSREHARCLQVGPTVEIEDLNSSNGTFVNDQRVSGRMSLRDGDIVRIGSILLKFFGHDNIDNIFHDRIYRMATIDAGTEIFNKKYLMEALEAEFRFAQAYQKPLSLIYFDLDFFKRVNDDHGHNCGDYILKEAAQVVKTCIRKDDILGRFGGEEFIVILPNTNITTASELAERIRLAVENFNFSFEGKTLKQTISLGVSQCRADFVDFKAFMEEADQKLYQSKKSGRNRVTA